MCINTSFVYVLSIVKIDLQYVSTRIGIFPKSCGKEALPHVKVTEFNFNLAWWSVQALKTKSVGIFMMFFGVLGVRGCSW
jgi:hypothetical protein